MPLIVCGAGLAEFGEIPVRESVASITDETAATALPYQHHKDRGLMTLTGNPMSESDPSAKIATKQVHDRRPLRFESLEDILDDATAMATARWRPLGNWSLGQACYHIAKTIDMSIDGIDYKAPLIYRIVCRLRRNKMLAGTFPPGFQAPPEIAARLETDAAVSDEQQRDQHEQR